MVRVWQSVDNEKGEEITDFTVAPKTPLTGEGNENRFAAATTGVLVVTYEYADEVTGEIKEAEAETSPINLRADYATSISAEWKHADDPEANAVTSGGTISKADITVTPVWKSGYVPTTNNVVDTEFYLLFKEKDMDKIQKKIKNLIQAFANAGLNATQTSNDDLRVILDNFLNGGMTTSFGTVMS